MPHKLSRRSFLKRSLGLLAACYVNPIALIPDPTSISTGNSFVQPSEMAAEALNLLEGNLVFSMDHFSKEFIEPAIHALVENIDKDIAETIIFRRVPHNV